MRCNLMDSVRQRTDKTFVNAQYQNSAVVILRSVGTFQMGIMNKPSKQNTMSGAVMVSYRSKKFIRKSVATDISLSSGKLVFDPDLHKSTLRVQTKEAIRDASSLDNESIEELNGALKNEKIISIS